MKVSVIIPVYNAARFLPSTIESVLMQSEVGEVLMINDASTDKSKEIILSYAEKDNRINYFETKKNNGSAHARNIGLDHATCPLISFLDADDLYLDHRFTAAINFLDQHPEIDGTYEDVRNVKLADFRPAHFEHGELISTMPGIPPEKLFDYLAGEKGPFFHISSLAIRREKLRGIRYEEDFKTGEDIDFSYQICKQLKLIHVTEEIKILRRLHSDNITSSNINKKFNDRWWLIQKWYKKILNENFSISSTRSIFIRYIHHLYIERSGSRTFKFRILVKAWYLLIEVIKYPKLIGKLV